MGYCPKCGAEYLPGLERCADCDVDLMDEPSGSVDVVSGRVHLIDVFSTGRRVDAELVRSMLEGHGLTAHLWAAGMGPWRMESALTEVTGVANAFNSYRVMVPNNQVEDAEALIADVEVKGDDLDPGSAPGLMGIMRSRWALVGAALFLLAMVALFGPPDYF